MKHLHVPTSKLWRPDIVLFNSADGNYDLISPTTSSSIPKATIYHTGNVVWSPSAILESSCDINAEFLPFDEQECLMKFGSWTYDGYQVDVVHAKSQPATNVVGKRHLLVWMARLSVYMIFVSGLGLSFVPNAFHNCYSQWTKHKR